MSIPRKSVPNKGNRSANFKVTKKNLVNILKIRNITRLRLGESISDAMMRSGGYILTKAEKIVLELIQ